MISAVLLVCIIGIDEPCHVDVSKGFYNTVAECQRRNENLVKMTNKNNSTSFYIKGTSCIAWAEDED